MNKQSVRETGPKFESKTPRQTRSSLWHLACLADLLPRSNGGDTHPARQSARVRTGKLVGGVKPAASLSHSMGIIMSNS